MHIINNPTKKNKITHTHIVAQRNSYTHITTTVLRAERRECREAWGGKEKEEYISIRRQANEGGREREKKWVLPDPVAEHVQGPVDCYGASTPVYSSDRCLPA